MKKVSIIISLALISAFISCDSDDDTTVEDAVEEIIGETEEEVSCEITLEGLEATVEAAITAFDASPQEETCQALKTAIEAYRTNDCGDEEAYAENYDLLTDDCLSLETPVGEDEMPPVEEEETTPMEEDEDDMPTTEV